jgi:hypothetical protein
MIHTKQMADLICVSWMAGLCDTKTLSSHTCDTNHCSDSVMLPPKKQGWQELQLAANLRVIRDAQISLCDIFGKI